MWMQSVLNLFVLLLVRHLYHHRMEQNHYQRQQFLRHMVLMLKIMRQRLMPRMGLGKRKLAHLIEQSYWRLMRHLFDFRFVKHRNLNWIMQDLSNLERKQSCLKLIKQSQIKLELMMKSLMISYLMKIPLRHHLNRSFVIYLKCLRQLQFKFRKYCFGQNRQMEFEWQKHLEQCSRLKRYPLQFLFWQHQLVFHLAYTSKLYLENGY